MDVVQSIAILLVGTTVLWAILRLRNRIEFLEHEVRWLRKELEAVKPTEVRSVYDKT